LDFFVIWASREQALRANRLFDLEWNNFREAVAWATSPPARPEPGTRERSALGLALLARVCGLWNRFDPAECRLWLEAILDVTDIEQSTELGTCLHEYAHCLMDQGDLSRAREVAQRSVALLRTLDDTQLAWALLCLSQIEAALGDSH